MTHLSYLGSNPPATMDEPADTALRRPKRAAALDPVADVPTKKIKTEHKDSASRVVELEQEIQKLKERRDYLESEQDVDQAEIEEKRELIEELEKGVKDLKEEVKDLKDKVKNLNKEVKTLREEVQKESDAAADLTIDNQVLVEDKRVLEEGRQS
jgi:chromosome segregation ATPase